MLIASSQEQQITAHSPGEEWPLRHMGFFVTILAVR